MGIDRWGLAELASWIEEHRALSWSPGDPLFCTRSGRAVDAAVVRRRLPELARAAGVHKRVHAHGLRHTHAADLRAEGVDLSVIRRQLGHASLLTTVPDHVRSDNGPEFIAGVVRDWPGRVGGRTMYIEPGSPWENGYVESINRKLRDELLSRENFGTLLEARVLIERWRGHYNTVRPHSVLGYRPPAPETIVAGPPSPPLRAALRGLAQAPGLWYTLG